MSQHGPIGRAAALRMTAAIVLTAWDAPEREGIDEAIAALREALQTSAKNGRAARPPRDPAPGRRRSSPRSAATRAPASSRSSRPPTGGCTRSAGSWPASSARALRMLAPCGLIVGNPTDLPALMGAFQDAQFVGPD